MKIFAPLATVGLVLWSWAASAQPTEAGTPLRVRGTIQELSGQTLTVQTESDGSVDAVLGPNVGINGLERKAIADIGDGRFVGTTAVRDADGRWRATEVHIFPEEMRGAGEGHYPWDFPNSTMTNATVSGTASASNGRTLKLTHAGGEVEVDVGPETEIVMLTHGDRSLLVPGATAFVLGTLHDDGTFDAIAVIAETNGVKPPM